MAPGSPRTSAASELEGLSIGDSTSQAIKSSESEAQNQASGNHTDVVPGQSSDELNEKQPYNVSAVSAGDEEYHTNGAGPEQRSTDATTEESKAEIASIMEQFGNEQGIEVMTPPTSPNRELPVFHYPPRSSSLDHGILSPAESAELTSGRRPSRDPDTLSYAPSIRSQPPPPEPDPEPDLPFDFHRFLEQLRHRTADPVAKFLRSFLQEFAKKQWQAHEQVKIIGDFLAFIANRMAQCEVWRSVSDAEFENAKEGMEKLVMNRLYGQTFSPEIPPAESSPTKHRRRIISQPLGPGRRGQHQEDIERDEVLAQKIRIYGWIQEEHLDIRPCNDKGKRFLILAQQELAKIKNYRAPRDKVICVLNTCKVIMGYLRNSDSDQSADSFIPLLIYTVLKSNPDHLVSNVQYIQRFRNPEKLNGEAGYYMSSLIGAVQFIETLDRTNLTISEEDFDRNVEASVSGIAKDQEAEEERRLRNRNRSSASTIKSSTTRTTSSLTSNTEKPLPPRPGNLGRDSLESEKAGARASRTTDGTSEASEGSVQGSVPVVAGLFRSIQKPLASIGRIFSDDGSTPTLSSSIAGRGDSLEAEHPALIPALVPTARAPRPVPGDQQPSHNQQPRRRQESSDDELPPPPPPRREMPIDEDRHEFGTQDAAAMQSSADSAEAYRIMQAEHGTVVETLAGMFPDLDRDIISDVVRMKGGNVGLAVDACLSLGR